MTITSLTLEKSGIATAQDTMISGINVYAESQLTTQLGSGTLSDGRAVINLDSPFAVNTDAERSLYIGINVADQPSQGRSIAINLKEASLYGGAATIIHDSRPNAYLGQPDSNIVIDGLFEDWSGYTMLIDPTNDPPDTDPNRNDVDIIRYNAVTEQVASTRTSSFYVEVLGNALSGVDVPISEAAKATRTVGCGQPEK